MMRRTFWFGSFSNHNQIYSETTNFYYFIFMVIGGKWWVKNFVRGATVVK